MAAFMQPGYVVSIVHNDKIIREQNVNNERTVRLPFGAEYSIRIKNKTDKRVLAQILIDGTAVAQGKLLMQAHQTMDITRFVLDGNMKEGKRFKFVEANNPNVQDPTAKENGEVEIIFEAEDQMSTVLAAFQGFDSMDEKYRPGGPYSGSIMRGMSFGGTIGATNCSTAGAATAKSVGDAGATVEGSMSAQKFEMVTTNFRTFAPQSMKIRLRGPVVEQPVFGSGQSAKPWGFHLEKGKVEVRAHGKYVGSVESFEVTSTHVVVKIPISEAQVGWSP